LGYDTLQRKVQSTARADQGQEGSFECFLQKVMKITVEMLTQEMLKQNPCCIQMLKDLMKLMKHPTSAEWVSLAEDYHTNTKVDTHIKIKDPGSFNIPISINGVFLGDALCDLGGKIKLMSLATFRKIKGLNMVPTEKLVRVVDGTEQEPEGVAFNMQVTVEDFKFLADIVLTDIPDCPITLGRPFLATTDARLNLEYKEIMLRSIGKYFIHQISQDNIRRDASAECHVVEDVDPYNSHEDIEQPRAGQEKYCAVNTKSTDVKEGATGGT